MLDLETMQQKNSSKSLTLLILSTILGIMAGSISIFLADRFASINMTYILIILLTLSIVLPVILRFIKKSFDLAEPAVWFAFYYFTLFVMRAVYDLSFGSDILGFKPDTSDLQLLNSSLLVATIGIIAFWVGYHLRVGRTLSNLIPKLPRAWNQNNALHIGVLFVAIGWLSRIILTVYLSGGLIAWLTSDKYVLLTRAAGTQYLNLFSSLAIIGLFILILYWINSSYKNYLVKYIILVFFILDVFYRIFSGSRFQLINLLISICIIYYMSSKRGYNVSLKYLNFLLILGVAFVIAYPVLSILRGGVSNLDAALSRVYEFWINPLTIFQIIGARQHGLDSLALIMDKVPKEEPFTLGSELLLIVVAWIPRQIWPDKPITSIGKIFYERFFPPIFHEGTSAAPTLPGEFYWAFGIFGVILGMLFIGILWRFLHEYLVKPKGNISNALMVSVIFSSFFIPAEQTIVGLLTMHLPVFFIVLFISATIKGRDLSLKGGL
ncbi:MAG: O-antigen polymerase [Candidatus Methanosuratincola petrocarbonis]